MGRGARSIQGSMGAYFRASVVALVLTGAVIWWGWPSRPPGARVVLPGECAWTSASLDDGQRILVLEPGTSLELAPGTYNLTLMGADGPRVVPAVVLAADAEIDLAELAAR